MRLNIIFFVLLFTTKLFQAQTEVKIENGIANLNGKPWLQIEETQMGSSSDFEVIKTFKGEVIAQLSFRRTAGVVSFRGEFSTLGKFYVHSYPAGTTLEAILDAYHKNKVVVEGKIDLLGLEKYCAEKKIILQKIISEEESKKEKTGK